MKVNQEKCSVLEKARPSLREKSFQFKIARSSGQGQVDAVCNEKYEVEGGCNGIKIILLNICKNIFKKKRSFPTSSWPRPPQCTPPPPCWTWPEQTEAGVVGKTLKPFSKQDYLLKRGYSAWSVDQPDNLTKLLSHWVAFTVLRWENLGGENVSTIASICQRLQLLHQYVKGFKMSQL